MSANEVCGCFEMSHGCLEMRSGDVSKGAVRSCLQMRFGDVWACLGISGGCFGVLRSVGRCGEFGIGGYWGV